MKRIALALLASAAAALAATTARADTRLSIGVHVGAPVWTPAPVVAYTPAPVVCPPTTTVVYAPPARGYWKDITVKTWVPERWVMSRDRWGRPVRVCEPGHYAFTTNRVWVDTSRGPHGYAYGYNR